MLTIAGNEAIDFQLNNKIAKSMTAIFQKAIDYLNNLDYSKRGRLSESEYRERECLRYCKRELGPEFSNYIKQQFNIEVNKFYFNSGLDTTVTGIFAIDPYMDDPTSVYEQYARLSGSRQSGAVDSDLAQLATMFDPKTGKVKKSKYGVEGNKAVKVNLFFDQVTAFLVQDRLNNHIVQPMVAEEIAAIMAHETGHASTLIEHSGDMYARVARMTKHLEILATYKDAKTIKERIVPDLQKSLTRMISDKSIKPNTGKALLGIVNGLSVALTEVNESYTHTVLMLFGQLIVMALIFVIKAILWFTLFGTFVLAVGGILSSTSVGGAKVSDTMPGRQNYYHVERLADEFVSRIGLGAPLASALDKLTTIMNLEANTMGSAMASSRLNRSLLMSYYLRFFCYVSRFINVVWLPSEYEDEIARVVRLLQNNMTAFKEDLPPEAQSMYLQDTERLMKQLDAVKKNSSAVKKVFDFLMSEVSPGRLLVKLATGDITVEVNNMLRSAENIIGTKFNYYGAKFSQLAMEGLVPGDEQLNSVIFTDDWESFINASNSQE